MWLVCLISRIFCSAVATRSGSPNASSSCWIQSGRSPNLTAPSSRMCSRIWPQATRIRWLNVYRIFDYSSGMLAGLSSLPSISYSIQPLNWVPYDPDKSRESGYCWPQSSGSWVGASAALAANIRALAYCFVKP